MREANWIRVGLCGVVTGAVWYVLNAVSVSILAQDFVTAVERGGPHARWGSLFFLVVDLLMGIWVVWLYSAIRPRYGARAATAVIAGVAWWAIKSLQSAKWLGLGFVSPGVVLVPLATTLVVAVVATLAGAWLYDRAKRPVPHSHSSA